MLRRRAGQSVIIGDRTGSDVVRHGSNSKPDFTFQLFQVARFFHNARVIPASRVILGDYMFISRCYLGVI